MKRGATAAALDTHTEAPQKPAAAASTEAIEPIHWKDAAKELPNLKVDGCDLLGNKMGWILKRSLHGKKFVIQGPPCTVVFAPSYLDQAKFGKENDPKRKKDKWSTTLRTNTPGFVDFMNKELKKVTLRHMFDNRTIWGGLQYEEASHLTAILPAPVTLDPDSKATEFKIDLDAEKDASKPNLLLRDWKTDEILTDATLGQHSVVVPIIDLSDVYIGRATKSKQYCRSPVMYVRELISDKRVDPRAYKRVRGHGDSDEEEEVGGHAEGL